MRDLGERVRDMQTELASNRPVLLANQIANLARAFDEFKEDQEKWDQARMREISNLKTTLLRFAFTITAGAVGLALTMVFAGHP